MTFLTMYLKVGKIYLISRESFLTTNPSGKIPRSSFWLKVNFKIPSGKTPRSVRDNFRSNTGYFCSVIIGSSSI